eukprot:Gb_15899 [translate_table: standard]
MPLPLLEPGTSEEPVMITTPSEVSSSLAPAMSQLKKYLPEEVREEVDSRSPQETKCLPDPTQPSSPAYPSQVDQLIEFIDPLISQVQILTKDPQGDIDVHVISPLPISLFQVPTHSIESLQVHLILPCLCQNGRDYEVRGNPPFLLDPLQGYDPSDD